jgi:hypothetical protein
VQGAAKMEADAVLRTRLDHPSALVQEHIQWALAQ